VPHACDNVLVPAHDPRELHYAKSVLGQGRLNGLSHSRQGDVA